MGAPQDGLKRPTTGRSRSDSSFSTTLSCDIGMKMTAKEHLNVIQKDERTYDHGIAGSKIRRFRLLFFSLGSDRRFRPKFCSAICAKPLLPTLTLGMICLRGLVSGDECGSQVLCRLRHDE